MTAAVDPVAPPRTCTERRAALLAALALLAIAGRALWVRWQLLDGSPFPVGVDGYFYPIQLRALLETGQLAYPTSPLAFWLMAPLAALTDPIFGAKLGATLAGAAATWPAYALGKRLGQSRAAGVAAALLATSTTGSLLLTADFVKNSFGVAFGLAALAALLAALDRPSRTRVACAALALLAAVLAHKSAAALAGLAGAPALARWLWRRGGGPRRLGLGALGALLAVLLTASAWAPERLLSFDELWRARAVFGGPWRWDLPALVVGRYRLPLGPEVALTLGVSLAALVYLGASARRAAPTDGPARTTAWMLAVLGVAMAWPTLDVSDAQGLGFRLRLLCSLALAASAAVLVGASLRWRPTRVPRLPVWAAAIAIAWWAAIAPLRLAHGVVYAHPTMVEAIKRLVGAVPDGELVLVSERHLAFMATWYARVPTAVRQHAPARHRWRLMPLAFIGRGTPLARALAAARADPDLPEPRGLHPLHPDGLVLVAEETWQWMLARLPPAARAYYAAWRSI